MSKKIIVAVALLAVIGVALMSFFGCGKNEQNNTDISTTASTTLENEIKETEATETTVTDDLNVTVTDNSTSTTEERVATTEEQVSVTEITTLSTLKKGVVYKVSGDSKIWANTVGKAYILFKNIDAPNEWGESGQVYELYVAQFGDDYSMWSDGYWSMDESGTTLKLTPKNQSENGNVGVDEGETKTITAANGVFVIDVTFSSGGKTTMMLKP